MLSWKIRVPFSRQIPYAYVYVVISRESEYSTDNDQQTITMTRPLATAMYSTIVEMAES